MAAVSYTTTQQIRATLGVSEVEVADNAMTDLDLETLIEIEIDQIYPDHAAAITASEALAATAAEKKLGKTLRLYCAYQGAVFLLPGLQQLIAQKISDGDAEMQRFAKDDLDKTKNQIIGMRDYLRGIINPTEYGATALALSPLIGSPPSYDPVTNEGA